MPHPKFVICTDNEGYEASLELRKLYRVIPDLQAETLDQLRVVDESGEDYLYPASSFIPIDLPASVAERVEQSA